MMSTTPGPAHLLFFDKPLAHDLVDRRFGDRRGDGFLVAIAVAIIGDRRSVSTNVVVKLVQCSGQLLSLAACFGIDIPCEVFQYLQPVRKVTAWFICIPWLFKTSSSRRLGLGS